MSLDGMFILTDVVNIDMLSPLYYLTKRYQTILDVFGLTQVVTHPTRITKTTKTLIDHLITSYPQKVTDTGVVPSSIVSDHDANSYKLMTLNHTSKCHNLEYLKDRSSGR